MLQITKYCKTPVVLTGVLFFLFLAGNVDAQESVVQSDFEHKVNLYDVNGKPWENGDVGVSGTPFFLDKWKYGRMRLVDKNVFGNIQLRLNLHDQQVHFLQSDNKDMFLPTGAVREISLFDSTGSTPVTYTFQCGFPAIDNQNENNFYLVLSDGKIKFLQVITKSLHQEKDAFTGETQKEYRQYEDYYFLVSGEPKLIRLKREKPFLLGMMKDKDSQVQAFLQKNKLSFKSVPDIKKLVDYYNSL